MKNSTIALLMGAVLVITGFTITLIWATFEMMKTFLTM